jgi:ADP-heptose:LPS heptosyltransferase
LKKEIHKVLIIRLSSIGDIVLTTPVIRCLKTQLPGAEVHYLTKTSNLPLLRANPYITKTWEFRNNFSELIPLLKKEGFDFIADLHKNLRSQYVRFCLNQPSASFRKLNFQKWLIVNLKIDLLPKIHIVDRYFEAVKPLDILNDNKGLDYFIPSGDEVDLKTLPEEFMNGYIAFVIGGKHSTKILPEEKVVQVCNSLNRPVLLMGGKEDAERGRRITEKITGTPSLNTCGIYSINQSASLVRQSWKVITNDTGLMHIAAAFHKPIISVWGNTIPEFGMYPLLPEEFKETSFISEVKGLSCRPCSKIGFQECPKKHFHCMNDQNLEAIINKLNS